jgi:diguanylate cyclase (GGDEF)-like protein
VGGQEFACEEEGQTVIPKLFLTDFRLADIPEDITIKPVESIEENTIHIHNDIEFCRTEDGSTIALVEQMFRRKFWDGATGLPSYVTALRQAIEEHEETVESDFQDDGDYIYLHFEIGLAPELEIEAAIRHADAIVETVEHRAEQLVARRRDGLLGIFDRGSFDADLQYALQNGGDPVGLLLGDIYHFKHVNDTRGHQAGDSVLRAVAKVISSRCQRNQVPYRYGGEELAVLATDIGLNGASQLAEAIRSDVEQLSFEDQPDLKITISVGIAVMTAGTANPNDLVKSADSALYRAKQDGRNCVRSG